MKRYGSFWAVFLLLMLATGCSEGFESLESDKYDKIDPKRGLSRSDYRDFYNQKPPTEEQKAAGEKKDQLFAGPGNTIEPPIPELQDIIVSPAPPEVGETQLVSVAVTDDVPLKDVLIELARLADVDIEVDAGITGGITLRAKDRPFNEVIARIADLAGLRYHMKHNVLRVERDLPYVQEYALNLLNIDRSSNNNISVNTTNGGAAGGEGAASTTGSNSGSTSTISGVSASDFWQQFEQSISRILAYQPPRFTSGTTIATQPLPTLENQNRAALLRDDEIVGGQATQQAAPAPAAGGDSFYVINRQAGTMTVSATETHHKIIERFLKKIEDNSSAQVLIEAKIVEVALNEEYKTGINWSEFGNGRFGFTALNFQGILPPNTTSTASLFPTDNSATFSILPSSIDLNLVANLTETFGTTRTISSPRLHATNNQQAVLSFAQNLPYFTLEFDTTEGTSGDNGQLPTTTVNSTLNTVPIGLILSLQPSINSATNEITLSVRPTLSSLAGTVEDPAVALAAASADIQNPPTSTVPIVEIREVDSIMKIKSGQVMVIGGLMESRNYNTDTGIPGVSALPFIGHAFKAANRYNTITELVIFIRATIIPTSGSADNADKMLYKKFINDPRPLDFK